MPVKVKRDDYLMHYGIRGQKWGRRRFENEDGTLTAAGKERYYKRADLNDFKREAETRVNMKVAEIKDKRATPQKSSLDRLHEDIQAGRITEDQMKDYIKQTTLEQTYLSSVKKNAPKSGSEKVGELMEGATGKTQQILSGTQNIARKMDSGSAAKSRQRALDQLHEDIKAGRVTEKQMRDYVNQVNLEQNYLNALSKNSPIQKSGAQKVLDVLEYAGAAVTVAAGTVGLAKLIHDFKK